MKCDLAEAQSFFGAYDAHQGHTQSRYYSGILDCVSTIYKHEGPSAFYSGLMPSVLKTSLAAGLSFAIFRSTKNLLESIHDNPFSDKDPPTRTNLHRRMTGR